MTLKKRILPCTLLVFSILLGCAGPESYEECVIEKMKGQDSSMRTMVNYACEKEFPFKRNLLLSNINDIDYEFDCNDIGVQFKIKENRSMFKIIYIQAGFYEKECSKIINEEKYDKILDFAIKDGIVGRTVQENMCNYKCIKILSLHGMLDK